MTERKRVPAIRFKGFTEDWEQRKVGDIADRFDNLRIPIASNLRVPGSVPYYGANGIQDFVEGYTHDGENVLIAEDGANDFKNYPVRYVIGKIWVNNHAHVLRGKQGKLDNLFFSFSLNQVDFESILVGGSRAKLNAETMMDISITVPEMKEQLRIGQLLYHVDTLITLHQRKVDSLKNVKQSMLTKMFPVEGETKPAIRFKGFTEDWEQRKLGEIAGKTYGGGTPSTANEAYWQGEIPWIQSSDIVEDKVYGVAPRKHISVEAVQKSAAQIVSENSIALVTRVGVGKLALLPFKYTTSQDFLSLSELKGYPLYIAYACYQMLKKDQNKVQGTSIKGVTKAEVLEKRISTPTYQEQDVIGRFFFNLDNLITLHQREVDRWKNVKQSMLTKMFV